MLTAQATHQYLDDYDNIAKQLASQEADWLTTLRARARQTFAEQGLPHRKVENWKYTSINRLLQHEFQLQQATKQTYDVEKLIAQYCIPNLACYHIVVVDGQPLLATDQLANLPAALQILPLATTLTKQPGLLQPLFDNIINYTSQPFAALNTLFFQNGLLINVAKQAVLDKPIHIMHINSGTQTGCIRYPRQFVLLGANSQATIIETQHSANQHCSFVNTVTEIMLQEKAQLKHFKSQHENLQSYHIAGIHVAQQRDSVYQHFALALGGELVRNDIHVYQQGKGTQTCLNGFYYVTCQQHINYHTVIDHRQPHGNSQEHFKGILDGNGHGVFNSKAIVRPHAQKTDATQMNHNLLLSQHAAIDTKPELEIYADDVKCKHGATVGQLDENALFYLQSRGFDRATAMALLIYGFASELINSNSITIPELQQYYQQQLLQHLPVQHSLEDKL